MMGMTCLHGTHVEVMNSTSTTEPGLTVSNSHGRSSVSISVSLPFALPAPLSDDFPPGENPGGSSGSLGTGGGVLGMLAGGALNISFGPSATFSGFTGFGEGMRSSDGG